MRVCGIAGFLFFGLKAAECIENAGFFRGDTGWHPVCKKLLVFRGSVRSLRLSARLGKRPLTILGQRGVVLGGVLGKNFASSRNFSSRVMPYAPMKIRSPYCTDAAKKDLSLSYRNMRGEKTTRFFRFSQFFGVLFPYGQHAGLSLIPAMAAERIIEKQPA